MIFRGSYAHSVPILLSNGVVKGWRPFGYVFLALFLGVLLFPDLVTANGNALWRGPTDNRVVALTFDDGPKSPFTQNLLVELRRLGVKATFFVVGSSVEKEPDLARQIADEGHVLANHSYSHSDFTRLSDDQIRDELRKTQALITQYARQTPVWFRPPGGNTDARVQGVLTEAGLVTVMWTINAEDYTVRNQPFPIRNEPKDIKGQYVTDYAGDVVRRVVTAASPGSIVLMHNGGEATLAALPQIVAGLREQGFGFVTLAELMGGGAAFPPDSP
jgi:peptidoglycan-N-acetylglucosamine deacetylase